MAATVHCHAPGKVMLVGGYVVLKQQNAALCVASNARFHASAQWDDQIVPDEAGEQADDVIRLYLEVQCPQLRQNLSYLVSFSSNRDQPAQISPTGLNKFVETTVLVAVPVLHMYFGDECPSLRSIAGLRVNVTAHNDFYSQSVHLRERGAPRTRSALAALPPGIPQPLDEETGRVNLHKTGLGSSAALVTSLVGVLLAAYATEARVPLVAFQCGRSDEHRAGMKELVHNIAQTAHCVAQGKVGSGFDVSTAVYGSQLYQRFSKEWLQTRLKGGNILSASSYHSICNSAGWEATVEPFALPPGIRVALADVDAGSNTPSMVGKVLQWEKDDPVQAAEIMETLAAHVHEVHRLVGSLVQAAETCATQYRHVLGLIERGEMEWDEGHALSDDGAEGVSNLFRRLRRAMCENRNHMKQMGDLAGVPIVPPEQDRLALASESIAGVLAAGLPGAGGFDAMFALYVCTDPGTADDVDPVRQRLETCWAEWREMDVQMLLSGAGAHGISVSW